MSKYIKNVTAKVIWKMKEIAQEMDIDRGGHYDCRMGCINIWVSPEDKPKDWEFPITKGALKYPREYLGELYWQEDANGTFALFLSINNYAREHHAEKLYKSGKISYEQFKEQQRLAKTGTAEEWKWLEEKARYLIELAEKEKIFEKRLRCPICGREDFETINDFVRCLVSHGVRVKSVVFPKGIMLEDGFHPFEDFLVVRKCERE